MIEYIEPKRNAIIFSLINIGDHNAWHLSIECKDKEVEEKLIDMSRRIQQGIGM